MNLIELLLQLLEMGANQSYSELLAHCMYKLVSHKVMD